MSPIVWAQSGAKEQGNPPAACNTGQRPLSLSQQGLKGQMGNIRHGQAQLFSNGILLSWGHDTVVLYMKEELKGSKS